MTSTAAEPYSPPPADNLSSGALGAIIAATVIITSLLFIVTWQLVMKLLKRRKRRRRQGDPERDGFELQQTAPPSGMYAPYSAYQPQGGAPSPVPSYAPDCGTRGYGEHTYTVATPPSTTKRYSPPPEPQPAPVLSDQASVPSELSSTATLTRAPSVQYIIPPVRRVTPFFAEGEDPIGGDSWYSCFPGPPPPPAPPLPKPGTSQPYAARKAQRNRVKEIGARIPRYRIANPANPGSGGRMSFQEKQSRILKLLTGESAAALSPLPENKPSPIDGAPVRRSGPDEEWRTAFSLERELQNSRRHEVVRSMQAKVPSAERKETNRRRKEVNDKTERNKQRVTKGPNRRSKGSQNELLEKKQIEKKTENQKEPKQKTEYSTGCTINGKGIEKEQTPAIPPAAHSNGISKHAASFTQLSNQTFQHVERRTSSQPSFNRSGPLSVDTAVFSSLDSQSQGSHQLRHPHVQVSRDPQAEVLTPSTLQGIEDTRQKTAAKNEKWNADSSSKESLMTKSESSKLLEKKTEQEESQKAKNGKWDEEDVVVV
ncbi:hypothetical protein FN846DRAFT_919821 [Sphaerosporella brunnea]|uniref:Uncharacterized protein n=1 Tax=Sphaerosporella brunnea TaxID=1250544 RepID=A0A5J5EUY1_9PEZI|nr:hypothetical protein FN846DRAFT_919821 [Sphaerosporella brunnea]